MERAILSNLYIYSNTFNSSDILQSSYSAKKTRSSGPMAAEKVY
jgi:hypothetical protein